MLGALALPEVEVLEDLLDSNLEEVRA